MGEAGARQRTGGLVGASALIEEVHRQILRVATNRHPVLILGESGTGKEVVARAIHEQGPWRDRPFVPVDCAALSPTLVESELFGHVRGAFTGASQARTGLFAEAESGTIFLDEIGYLAIDLQTKLLRVLQEGEVRPLGGNQRQRVEARVIAATNVDLKEAVKKGTFRPDLYFRLNVVSIKLPPLRDRKEDIPALVEHLSERHGGRELAARFSPEAMKILAEYDWPGNVRELENCVQRALALGCGPTIGAKDLRSTIVHRGGQAEGAESNKLKDLERRAILQALKSAGGDRARAARLLGIGKTTIYRKLKEYGLETEPPSVVSPK